MTLEEILAMDGVEHEMSIEDPFTTNGFPRMKHRLTISPGAQGILSNLWQCAIADVGPRVRDMIQEKFP